MKTRITKEVFFVFVFGVLILFWARIGGVQ